MILEGKVVVVTGAARGLGREYVRRAAAEGAKVVASDIMDCAETIAEAQREGGEVTAYPADVSDAEAVTALAEHAVTQFGGLDAWVNNAALFGGLRIGGFEGIDPAEWDAAMEINVKGIWHCCKAAVPAMRAAGSGSIINVSSLAATYGMPSGLHYTTSKAAVIGLTRGLAREVGRHGIRVNAIAPSLVLTEGTEEFFADRADKAKASIAAGQAIPKNLETGDVAGVVCFLASDASRFITGQTIMVDGGTVLL